MMDRLEFGKALCDALGEKGERVISIDLHFGLDGSYTATIVKYIDDKDELIEAMKKVVWEEDVKESR